MPRITLENFGAYLSSVRGSKGIRAASAEIGVSTATLSRIENGQTPDLETFRRICEWLKINPGEVLGFETDENSNLPRVHFRKKAAISRETAESLSELIIKAVEHLDAETERSF